MKMVQEEVIAKRVLYIRGHKIMLDRDLAELYGVPTRRLNEQVKRNLDRFPEDFMFQLTRGEMKHWISQIAISNKIKMGVRRRPYAFTEQGVAMLSSVLNSKRAVQVNIAIMRVFVRLRDMLTAHKELAVQLEKLERKIGKHDAEIRTIFRVLKRLMTDPPKKKEPIGFKPTRRK